MSPADLDITLRQRIEREVSGWPPLSPEQESAARRDLRDRPADAGKRQ